MRLLYEGPGIDDMVEVVLNPELLTGRIRAYFRGQHEDVEEFGGGSGTEGVEALLQSALEFIWTHYAIAGS